MRIFHFTIIGILLISYSCNMPSNNESEANQAVIDSLENEISQLKLYLDSLYAEVMYLAQENKELWDEREALKNELKSLKKKYNIRSSDGSNPLAKYNLEMTRFKTGYVFSSNDRLFLPAITFEFKNKSSADLTQRVFLKYIFINKKTGEQLHESTKTLCDSYSPLAGGLVKQITSRSEVGWYAVKDQEVSVRVYIRDVFWKEFKIESDQYEGRI